MVFDLMFELGATEEQLGFPVVYGSAKNNWMGEDYNHPTEDIHYLLDKFSNTSPLPRVSRALPNCSSPRSTIRTTPVASPSAVCTAALCAKA